MHITTKHAEHTDDINNINMTNTTILSTQIIQHTHSQLIQLLVIPIMIIQTKET